jgi:hypothetical protein
MANPFETLRAKSGDGQKSVWWYMRNVQKIVGATSATPNATMQSDLGEMKSNIEIGSMYLYYYDPKWKKELPFYDTFPLVLPFGPAPGGFYGINLHYAPYMVRAKILGELLNYTSSKTYNASTKIKMSYQLLKGLSNSNEVKPCIKHYLTPHVRSRFLKINPIDWKTVIFLPLEQFQKKTKDEVFRDSRSKF